MEGLGHCALQTGGAAAEQVCLPQAQHPTTFGTSSLLAASTSSPNVRTEVLALQALALQIARHLSHFNYPRITELE